MKKICFVTTVSLTMKAFVLESAKYLHENGGYDVTLICNNDDEFAASLPEYIKFIPVSMARGVDLSAISSVFQFIKIFKKEKFDIIQYSTPNASLYASIGAFLAGARVRRYSQCGIRYVAFEGFSRKFFKIFEKITCKLSTAIKAQSPKNMQFAIDEGLCKKDKISVIGIGGTIGVDLSQCRSFDNNEAKKELREKYGIPQDAFVYGYVGRVNVDKGTNELITAFNKNSKDDENIYLALVGMLDDANPISDENLEIAKNHPRIIMTGNVDFNEVYPHMAMFDVLVHPTYREGFGKVLQEAMGVGLPIITTNVPGPSEVVENNISGILCEVKNSDDLAEKMLLLRNDGELLKNIAEAGSKRAEKYFDRPIMLKNILDDMNETAN